MHLILASASPRRRELLTLAGFEFEVIPSDADEGLPEGTQPRRAVEILSERKAECILNKDIPSDAVVIASDTVVVLDGEIFGKPAGTAEAFSMLRRLSARTHSVYTGVCIASGESRKVFSDETKVSFLTLSDDEINEYIASGESFDKAGAYGIQGKGALLIKGIEGDFYSVMGLPVARTAREIRSFYCDGSEKNAEEI